MATWASKSDVIGKSKIQAWLLSDMCDVRTSIPFLNKCTNRTAWCHFNYYLKDDVEHTIDDSFSFDINQVSWTEEEITNHWSVSWPHMLWLPINTWEDTDSKFILIWRIRNSVKELIDTFWNVDSITMTVKIGSKKFQSTIKRSEEYTPRYQ